MASAAVTIATTRSRGPSSIPLRSLPPASSSSYTVLCRRSTTHRCGVVTTAVPIRISLLSHSRSRGLRPLLAFPDSEAAPTTAGPAAEGSQETIELEVSGGDGGGGEGPKGGSGGGGGRDGDREGSKGGSEEEHEKKMSGMSMSQKLTLGYAVLVGVGGVMGYLKSGSQKSLAAGGISAVLLFFVYTQLPVRPAFASSLGLGLSAALLAVMGSRFKNSGKLVPAGIVSLVSLVMAGGYFHGILRGLHG